MTDSTLQFLGISGSLRKGSFSTALLMEIVAMSDDKARITPFLLTDVPLYNADLEPSPGNAPEGVTKFRNAITAADGLVLISPEYNYGVSGVLKNALDWASRPAYKSVLLHKPVLIITSSPGAFGGVRAQGQLKQTLLGTLSRVVGRAEIAVAHVGAKLADGHLTDEPTRGHFKEGLADLAAEVHRSRA